MPEIGEKSPNFALPRDGGGIVSLADYAGKTLVMYFYPRDDTPGCTTESISFTQHLADFQATGAEILGVSKDSIKSHDKFVAKHFFRHVLVALAVRRYGRLGGKKHVRQKIYGH